jgi:putative heme-binding domain-containing protein
MFFLLCLLPLSQWQLWSAPELKVLPGFKVEQIRASQEGEGSWICMTVDPQGRLIIAQQGGVANMLRVTLSRAGKVAKVEKIDQPVGSAMGLLCAFDSLYVNGLDTNSFGFFRLPYNQATDRYDAPILLRRYGGEAGSEHGAHGIVLGPDNKLYVVCGNFIPRPKDVSSDSPFRNFAEDLVLPRDEDSLGFSIGNTPPEGFVLRTDCEGVNWELFAGGLRNVYDIAFNSDGELFGFDSDAECDWGLPWYRPIRVLHLVSGGEYGFREGTGKWPAYYEDSLPPAVDVGVGSPTGIKFGANSNFPDKYKKALFALDWSYGRIFAIHLSPEGASYRGVVETFLSGTPLNLTDVEFGHDGAMYFITGGRGTAAGLYRVSYVGPDKYEDALMDRKATRKAERARTDRRKLETLQQTKDKDAVALAWPPLNSDDRFIRYAARVALETRPVAEWQERTLSENRTNAALTASLALARCGNPTTQPMLIKMLQRFPLNRLNEEQQLIKLRALELSFARQKNNDVAVIRDEIADLSPFYPSPSDRVNRELSQLLIYLQAPDVVKRTLALLDTAPTQEEQIHYVFILRNLKTGWTKDQREHYFEWFARQHEGSTRAATYATGPSYYPWASRKGPQPRPSPELVKWLNDAGRDYGDGCSYPAYLANIFNEAVSTLSDRERAELAPLLIEPPKEIIPPQAQRKFVQEWKMNDLLPALSELAGGRDVFTDAQCIRCHRFGNQGGAVGPDVTAVGSRYGHREILESILEPSKVINEQYQSITIVQRDGDDVTGRIVHEDYQTVTVVTDPLAATRVQIAKTNIARRLVSKISPMPEGLVNTFTREEILDLIAYLESDGKDGAPAFQKK